MQPLWLLLFAALLTPLLAQAPSVLPGRPNAPKTAVEWFRRADELTNLRMPGAGPFHMKVTFHAYPGMDFAKKGKPEIITGDGTYEEWWLSPETWRREVTFPGYHAVEVRANGVRRYQADSDYEPSRVLMMLDALLYPVPRNLVSPEFSDSHENWKIERLTAGTMPYVTLTHRERGMNDDWFYYQYSFLPNGILVRSNYLGLVTSWDKDTVFAGKLVPQHLEIQAMGRTLLTADVTITAAGSADPKLFHLDGPAATPGMTMRPLHEFEIRPAQVINPVSEGVGTPPRGVIRQIVDREGRSREVELIDGSDPESDEEMVESDSSKRFHAAKVDGDPCEETLCWRI